ncbi:hypothetical protein MN086_07390 [Sulfurovum sp. XGS-02]|uniref:hypothetical protein n=1 Tax=Sulfurovum sp. XGS-02 TaxID=2925411 RepID=UPI002051C440|nr:hypothetical protein [Sulfurovum sp. XGS-02]UPT76877.1 hypothetical protein MN086_07390 [Sulfurovum sp. XGS-02]
MSLNQCKKRVGNVVVSMVFGMVGLVGLSGCAGSSPSTEAKQTLQSAEGYQVGQVNVTLTDHVFYDFSEEEKHYPNEKELASFFKEDIEKYLKQAGRSCQGTPSCLTLDLDINYLRNFNMGSVSVSAPTIDRTLTIRQGDTVVYNNTQKELKLNKGGIVGNTLNELALFTKAGEEKANVEDERKDIQVISQVTVKDIERLSL